MDRTQLDQSLGTLAKTLGELAGLNASVVLYGSAARSDWVPGRSDVNLLVLVDDTSSTALRRLTPAVTEWHTKGFAPPLIMGREEWQRSADVFPIEIADMQVAHRVLCGVDRELFRTVALCRGVVPSRARPRAEGDGHRARRGAGCRFGRGGRDCRPPA